MKKESKLIAVILALVMVVGMTSGTFAATDADVQSDSNVEKSKVATELNENDETTVTLKIGAGQKQTVSDVVFALDYSTSSYVRDQALKMLDELLKQAENHKIKVGIVNFYSKADVKMGLTELTSESYKDMVDKIAKTDQDGGTNMPDGLNKAYEMLKADGDVADGSKHVVLVSDGLTYQWGNNPEKGVYTLTNIESLQEQGKACDPVDTVMYGYYKNSFAVFKKDVSDGMLIPGTDKYKSSNTEEKVSNTLKYEVDYGDATNVIPAEQVSNTVTTFEVSAVKSAELWQQMKGKGYNLYVFGDRRQEAKGYIHGLSFMKSLSIISGEKSYKTFLDAEGVEGLFDNVKSSILYDIAAGTVTDVIGKDFDLIGLNTFKLVVGDKEMKATVDENNNSVYFGDADENNKYPYVVKYTAGENEQFVWEINVPVETAKSIQLSYGLKLVNKAKDPGTYETDTNEIAVLEYTSSNGTTGHEEFNKPTVSYTVAAGQEGVDDPTDAADITDEEAAAEDAVKTGDTLSMMMLIALILAMVGGAVVLITRKRRSI
ncbi:MAG: VWA domain-containing protein [Lentihominibacter sp.]